ncbi:hypothetical protein [Thermus albus]|uniref:hypothetical protein n=1 Tax=Thermus albus TaxID=2908146 RepID=UPI001FAB20C8|nr:hypothetical protein [Thermus albus]
MHWDDLERLVSREQARKRWEEGPLHDRIQKLEAQLFEARMTIRHLLEDKRELRDRCQALALGQVYPVEELGEVKRILEEAWLELVLVASPKAEALSTVIQRLERHLLNR